MHWFEWILIAVWALEVVGYVGNVGKPRQPVDHSLAISAVLINGLLIAGLIHYWGK